MFSRNNATVQTITPDIHSAVNMFGRGGKMQQGSSCESFCLYLSIYIHYKVCVSSYPCPATKYIWTTWKVGFSYFLWTRGLFQDPAYTNINFKNKDIMCSPGCHHLPDKIPGTPGKLLVHASYSLLWMCLDDVFELNLFFLFRTLKFSQVKWSI